MPFEVNYHKSTNSYLKFIKLIHARKGQRVTDQRLSLAHALARQMQTLMRHTAPDEADAAAWEAVIDMDTNRPVWFPKELSDEYQRLRFTDLGEPRP
jgi:hypothetical protein